MNRPAPKPTRPLTEAEQITSDILTYLDTHGFSAWGQPNRGEYERPLRGKNQQVASPYQQPARRARHSGLPAHRRQIPGH